MNVNLEIKKLSSQDIKDFSELVQVFANVFEWENVSLPSQLHLQKLIDNCRFIALVAKLDNQLIGGLTAHVLDRYDSEKPSVYIYDVAILSNYQHKGIGKKLISTVNKFCAENGFSEAFVQAETEDVNAVNFYRKTPINEELQATHFTYSFRDDNQQ